MKQKRNQEKRKRLEEDSKLMGFYAAKVNKALKKKK